MREDLSPDRIVADYRCRRAGCGANSTWRKSFPDSAFETADEMEWFFRDHLLRGHEKRCGSCGKPLRTSDLTRAQYSCWCGRVGQELVLEMIPRRGTLFSSYPIRRYFVHEDGEREFCKSPHDPRLRSVMIDSILRAGALRAEQAGGTEEGLLIIRRAMAMDPDDARGHARLGEALFRLGRIDETEEALRGALLRDRANETALDLLARICHSTGRWAEAETYYRRVRSSSGDLPEHLLGEAKAQVRLGRHADAYRTARDLLQKGRGSLPALTLAAILAEDVDGEKSRPLLERLEAEGERPSARALASERLALQSLPRFAPRIGEERAQAMRRMETAFHQAELTVDRWQIRGKKMGGRKTSLGRRSVYLNIFPGGFDARGREELTAWLRQVRSASKAAYVQVYSPTPCPYAVRKMASTLPEALLDLGSDDLVSPRDPEASARSLREAAAALGGLPGDVTPEALEAVDHLLLERFHDEGFGEIRPPTALLFAHYAGEVIRGVVGGEWIDADPMRILSTPEGGIDLLAKVDAIVINGPEDSLAYLLEAIRSA